MQGDDDAVPIFKGVRKEDDDDDDDDDDDEEEEEEGERTRAPEEAMEEERSIVIIIRGVRFFVSRTFQVPREAWSFASAPGKMENWKIIITFSGVVTKDTKRNVKLKSRKASRAGARARRK